MASHSILHQTSCAYTPQQNEISFCLATNEISLKMY